MAKKNDDSLGIVGALILAAVYGLTEHTKETILIIGAVAVLIIAYIIFTKHKDKKREKEILSLLDAHIETLAKKYRQLSYKDDYGVVNSESFKKEVNYFLNKVMVPQLNLNEKERSWMFNTIILYMERNVNIDDISFSSAVNPYDFEKQCAQILKENGWDAHATSKSSDQGVDVIATKNGKIVAIQCKLYSSAVGNKAVQEVCAGKDYYKAKYAVVVSNSTYTKSARQLAQNCGVFLLTTADLPNLEHILDH